jgi:hypothetical protein
MPQPDGWKLADGRQLPNLLFVTCVEALGNRIGLPEANALVTEIRSAGKPVAALTLAEISTISNAIVAVTRAVSNAIEGIVLLGGLETVPAERLDVLTPQLATKVSRSSDEDAFVIWCDDNYGNPRGELFPTIPVSRIPDAGSAQLLWKCLACPSPLNNGRGLRNVRRPFADPIYTREVLNAAVPMLTSEPIASGQNPPYDLSADSIYIMLHGSDSDGTTFWGESNSGFTDAVKPVDVPSHSGDVTLAGCCWAALTTTHKASDGMPAVSRSISDSTRSFFS